MKNSIGKHILSFSFAALACGLSSKAAAQDSLAVSSETKKQDLIPAEEKPFSKDRELFLDIRPLRHGSLSLMVKKAAEGKNYLKRRRYSGDLYFDQDRDTSLSPVSEPLHTALRSNISIAFGREYSNDFKCLILTYGYDVSHSLGVDLDKTARKAPYPNNNIVRHDDRYAFRYGIGVAPFVGVKYKVVGKMSVGAEVFRGVEATAYHERYRYSNDWQTGSYAYSEGSSSFRTSFYGGYRLLVSYKF